MGTTTDDEQVIREVMDRWKAAVDAHEPAQVAACFTEDAIFQGMRPYSVGRPGVTQYYASRPMGMPSACTSGCSPPGRRAAGNWPTARCRTCPE